MAEEDTITGEALLALIPQRPPVVMVGWFSGIREGVSYTGLKVEEENIFCDAGRLQEYGLLEHIAQSAAVRIGWLYRQAGREIPVGFIGSIDKMQIYALPETGSCLQTEIRVEQEIFGVTLIAARVYGGEKLLAEGQMKIVLKEEHV